MFYDAFFGSFAQLSCNKVDYFIDCPMKFVGKFYF